MRTGTLSGSASPWSGRTPGCTRPDDSGRANRAVSSQLCIRRFVTQRGQVGAERALAGDQVQQDRVHQVHLLLGVVRVDQVMREPLLAREFVELDALEP